MAEVLGQVAEEKVQENTFEIVDEVREPEREPEAERGDVPNFSQSENHFQGQAVLNEFGRVIDYRYAGGAMSAVAEGALLEKILSRYQDVLERGEVVVRMPDPENSFITIVHTLQRSELGNGRIDTWITREQKVQAEVGAEKKSGALSPAELLAAEAEKFWLLAATAVEAAHEERGTDVRAEKIVVSISEYARIVEARAGGITIEGLRPSAQFSPQRPAHSFASEVSEADVPEPSDAPSSAPTEDRATEDGTTEKRAAREALEAVQYLRAA